MQQNSAALQQKLSERQKLLGQLDQAKMQEQMNKAMSSLSETVGDDVPTLDEVRQKIEARYAKAKGMSELTDTSVESRMLEIEQASMNRAGPDPARRDPRAARHRARGRRRSRRARSAPARPAATPDARTADRSRGHPQRDRRAGWWPARQLDLDPAGRSRVQRKRVDAAEQLDGRAVGGRTPTSSTRDGRGAPSTMAYSAPSPAVKRTSSPSAVLPVGRGPRARAVDRVAVHPQPPADGEQPPRLHERDGAVAGRADVEQQVAAVRHDLDEHPHEVVGGRGSRRRLPRG